MANWQGKCYLLANVPADAINQPTFGSASAQLGWFIAFDWGWSGDDLYFIREDRAFVKVPVNIERLRGVNWIAYQNADYSERWYYARVTHKAYSSPEMTQVFFEIDSFQTYQFDITFEKCYVEREHITGDWAGAFPSYANLTSEGQDTGEYTVYYSRSIKGGQQYAYILTTEKFGGGTPSPTMQDGVFTGCQLTKLPVPSGELETFISYFVENQKEDAIVAIIQAPEGLESWETVQGGNPIGSFGGYVPQNAKLYTFPYNFMQISNNQGSEAILHYEDFNDPANPVLRVKGCVGAQPTWMIWPQNYKGLGDNTDEGVMMSNFPVCAWSSNAFANWMAQNGFSTALGAGSGLVALGAGAATLNPMAVVGGLAALGGTVGNVAQKQMMPNTAKGHAAGAYINVAIDKQEFTINQVRIRRDAAERIDNYFSRFGYFVGRTKVPNVRTRPRWNYVQTRGAIISGRCDYEDAENIRQMLNTGVTFWRDGYQMGNYDNDNKG